MMLYSKKRKIDIVGRGHRNTARKRVARLVAGIILAGLAPETLKAHIQKRSLPASAVGTSKKGGGSSKTGEAKKLLISISVEPAIVKDLLENSEASGRYSTKSTDGLTNEHGKKLIPIKLENINESTWRELEKTNPGLAKLERYPAKTVPKPDSDNQPK